MKINPINDRVIVVRLDEEKKTTGGIIIPDTAKEKPQQGKVVCVGPGRRDDSGKRIPMQVKKGDHIIFSKYAGAEIKLDNLEHIFLREDDILGVISKN